MDSGEKSAPPPYASLPPPQQQGPPPGFYPPPQPVFMPVQTTVYPATVAVVTGVPAMGTQPSFTVCKSCNQEIRTEIRHKANTRTHLFALLLCLIGCWPCAIIPYCTDSCQSADHYCPNCQAYVGSYIG